MSGSQDSKVSSCLKDLPQRLQTPSLVVRKNIFHDLTDLITTTDLAENIIKGLCKVLSVTLLRYQDAQSRLLVLDLIKLMSSKHPSVVSKAVHATILEYIGGWKNTTPTKSLAKPSLAALAWSCAVINDDSVKDDAKKIVETQSLLAGVIFTAGGRTVVRKAVKILGLCWTKPGLMEKFVEILINSDHSLNLAILGSQLLDIMAAQDNQENIPKVKTFLTEILAKTLLMSKSKLSKDSLRRLEPFLKQLSLNEIKEKILPVMNKSLLRSPEIALSVVSVIISCLSVDMSNLAADLGQTFCTNLKSKDDQTREDAVEATIALARNCKDSAAVEKLLDNIFSTLGGKDGKISLNTVKMSLLTSAGGITNADEVIVNNLTASATKKFVKFLQEESHEATLITALEQLASWAKKYTKTLPEELVAWIPKGLTDKNSSSPVKCGYLMCLASGLNSSTLASAKPLVQPLMKIVEAAKQQSAQAPLVSEAVIAGSCLMTIDGAENNTDLASLLSIVSDTEKCMFFQDKFLSSTTAASLSSLSSLITSILTYHHDKVSSVGPLYKCLGLCLVSPSSQVRGQAVRNMSSIGRTLGGVQVVTKVMEEMVNIMASKTVTVERIDSGQGGELAASDSVSVASVLASASGLVTGVSWSQEDSVKISLSLLPVLHHPIVILANPNIWSKMTLKMSLKPEQVLKDNRKTVIGLVEELIRDKCSVGKEVVKTLTRYCPKLIVEQIVEQIQSSLTNEELLKVSVEDFMIYQTPEGELYDKAAIDNIKSDGPTQNMKRENKAYSYKEQMEEQALRKELEAKKAKEGKLKAPALTQKQKDLMKQLMAKESETRASIKVLAESSKPCLDMVDAVVAGSNASSLAPYLHLFLQHLYKASQSPLIAERVTKIIYNLRKSVFGSDEEGLAQLVAGVSCQIIKPSCQSHVPWSADQLKKSLAKTVLRLHTATVPPKTLEEDEEDKSCPLSAPAMFYSFIVLKKAMQVHLKKSEVLHQCFDIIAEHTELRGSDDEVEENDEIDLFHPRFLPRYEMMSVLLDLISQTEGTVQQTAVKCLIDTAAAASGDTGCATAGDQEVAKLLSALYSDTDAVRDAALRGLQAMVNILPQMSAQLPQLVRRVWVLRCDTSPENRQLAEQLWTSADLSVTGSLCLEVMEDVAHPVAEVRQAAAEALSSLLEDNQDQTGAVLTQLLETYTDKLEMSPPVMDHLGRIVEQACDHWEPRSGIALALAKIQPYYDDFMVTQAVSFFVPQGLGDRNEVVRKDMLGAAVATIDNHGKNTVADLLPVFEDFLDNAPADSSYDIVRQSVVILMGGLARHLDKEDPKVRPIIGKLIAALATPSQQVQEAVANCLPPLVPAIKDEAPKLVGELLETLLNTENFGERKGAAYGLAGLVKGLGILSLKQLDIMTKLTEALQDKKNYRYREGSLLALSQLCAMLGRLFEPYIVHVLPHLLLCFGDSNQYVREATDECAKAVMSKLSAHGVKLVLPSLLAALEEDQWRTKTGSVELLGAMAFCAPKQLSSCLPSIVPKLIEVLGDSHQKVQAAGAQALKVIGSVIRNPEIQAIVPTLLAALQDPAKKTGVCLQTLLDTKFVHFIDAPSLALIMPAVQRAFQDRSTETRKMAAQIIGNMYSLTDQKDLAPYLPGIIPGLKASLLDPVPEVRGVSARALGAMVKGMGEQSFEELLPWLMSTLTSESSSVDRSGAAQGLAEVVGGLGVDKMHKLMPEIVSTAERMDIAPHVKDGYIMMFIYMPAVFPEHFKDYIGEAVKPILRALADENEFVRETALKAGQRIVNMYADTAITLLLPQLEGGLFDDNWRIRYSSIQLLGDLLYKISGVSGKMTTASANDDDNFGTEQGQKIITNMLGNDRRNRVLAGLYMGRSDVALMVRQSALHVWKVIVTNTPKTLREILPTLFNLLLGCLASANYDKRQVAARTLGDLVRKLGERVLPEIIPILERGLDSDDKDKRQGVCVGLSEIMSSTSRDMVLTFVDSLVPTVRKALCDNDGAVRQAAAKTFDSLHNTVGARALDDILPSMLDQLSDPDMHENTLDGLRQIMAIKSRAVLPYLIPQLTATPVNTKALSILASVAGESLNKHLAKILPALLTCLAESHGTAEETAELGYARAVVLSVQDETGVSYVMDILLDNCKSKDAVTRRGAVTLLAAFCDQTKVDISEYVPQLLRSLILLFTDTDKGVLAEAHSALTAVTKSLDPGQQMSTVPDIRQAVRFAAADLKSDDNLLPGFCLPKGIAPLLPIFRESILNGAPELKEAAAHGLGEIIKLTSVDALKPSVVHITGPLIRILGDRFSHNVKTAVLDTLAILLSKASAMLKPFLPQLQTTFLKALNDPHRTVRLKAGFALSHLITIHTRPDPLYNELHTGMKNSEDSAVRDTYIQAMRGCVAKAGDKLSPTIRRTLTATLQQLLTSCEDVTRSCAAGCLASLLPSLPEEELSPLMTDIVLLDDSSADWTLRHGRSATLAVLMAQSPATVASFKEKVSRTMLSHMSGDHVNIVTNGVRSAGYLILDNVANNTSTPSEIITPFVRSMNHSSNDVKILVAQMISLLAKSQSSLLPTDLLKPIVPTLISGTMEKNSMVRSCSETALVDILQLRRGPQGQSEVLLLLEAGTRETLVEIISKSLTKLATQQEDKNIVLDDTLLL